MTLEERQSQAYDSLDNYKIVYSEKGKSTTVAVYFTSHSLFYPDTLECFDYSIFENDRYEWTRQKIKRASKHIFLRDVFKCWYVFGISAKIHDIPSLAGFLEAETKGFEEIIMVGSSAGGTAAALFGSLLNADIIFDFNGQWEINSSIRNFKIDKLIEVQDKWGGYYDLLNVVHSSNHIFYFVSEKSKWDSEQFVHSQNLKINRLFFKTSHHGIPFLKVALEKVLNMNSSELEKLSSNHYNPIMFTMTCVGLIKTLHGLYRQIKHYFKI